MATADEYAAWIVKNADKKGTPDFDTVAKAYQAAKAESAGATASHLAIQNKIDSDPISQGAANFAQDMPWYQKALAGAGKAFSDTAQGVGQRLGLVDQSTVDETKRLDAPLMKTGAGMAGNIGGNIAIALPTIAIPGANTALGAAAVGGVLGAIQPTEEGESALKNAAVGAGLGAGSVAAGKLIGAGYRGVKAVLEPLTETGPQQIAGRTLERFASNPNALKNVTNAPTITGARPTLAEQTGDIGIARLQDALNSSDPALARALDARASENNLARIGKLTDIAGTPQTRAAAEAARADASSPLYNAAKGAVYTVDPKLADLLQRPSVAAAARQAETLAADQGRVPGFTIEHPNPFGGIGISDRTTQQVTGQGLQDIKMAMDQMLTDPTSGFAGAKGKTLADLRAKMISWMEDANPTFKEARTTFADKSRPLNQLDLAAEVLNKGAPGAPDISGVSRLQPNALERLFRNQSDTIENATGRKGLGQSFEDVLDPKQLEMFNAIKGEVQRAGAVQSAGNGAGSATAQRLASQNILRQVMAPSGNGAAPTLGQKLGASIADHTLSNTIVGKATNWIYSGIAEPKIQAALAKAVLEPEEAAAAIAAARAKDIKLPPGLQMRLLAQAGRVTAQSAAPSTRQP